MERYSDLHWGRRSARHWEVCWDTGYQLVGYWEWRREPQTPKVVRSEVYLANQLGQNWVER